MWRRCAKLVAILDITVICFISVFILLSLLVYGYGRLVPNGLYVDMQERPSLEDSREKELINPYPPGVKYILLAAAFGIPALIILLLLWTTINLLGATSPGEKPEKAKMMATLYRDVTIALFLLIAPVLFIRAVVLVFVGPFIIWRSVSIFVSHGFIKTLEQRLKAQLDNTDDKPLPGDMC